MQMRDVYVVEGRKLRRIEIEFRYVPPTAEICRAHNPRVREEAGIFGFTKKASMTNHLYAHTAIFLRACRGRTELGQKALCISLHNTGEEYLRTTNPLSSEDRGRKRIYRIMSNGIPGETQRDGVCCAYPSSMRTVGVPIAASSSHDDGT